jgi:hypothetical protein
MRAFQGVRPMIVTHPRLLHAPSVRVKELAGSPEGEEDAAALRVLFDLDARTVEAVTRAAPETAVHPLRRRAAESSYSYPDHGGTR